jgi:hypothetical protein
MKYAFTFKVHCCCFSVLCLPALSSVGVKAGGKPILRRSDLAWYWGMVGQSVLTLFVRMAQGLGFPGCSILLLRCVAASFQVCEFLFHPQWTKLVGNYIM